MWTPNPAKIITAEMKAGATQAARMETFRGAIQAHVDAVVRVRAYDSWTSLAGYVSSTTLA